MNKTLFNVDWLILLSIGVLIIFSLSTLLSISVLYFRSQLGYLLVGILAFFFFSNVNYKIFQLYSIPIYVFSTLLLFIVLLIGIESRGAVRWIDILGVKLQFSEILKPFLVISFSSYISGFKNYSFRSFLLCFVFLSPIVFFVYMQPDLGNALIYLIAALATLLVSGFPLVFFGLGALFSLLSSPVFWILMRDYQKQRIFTFLDPSKDPLGTSYNAIQSIMAVGSGMLIGRGLTGSTQSALRFLPERHTDFIFAALSEEFGFIGSMIMIGAFLLLLYRIYLISKNSDDNFSRIFCSSSLLLILIQVFVNIGMNVGVIPVVGVTLPFVSYGGSSILSNFILLGFLSSIIKQQKKADILEIR